MLGSGRYARREEGVHLVSWQMSLAVRPCGEPGLCQAASALLPDLTRGCRLLVTSAPSLFLAPGTSDTCCCSFICSAFHFSICLLAQPTFQRTQLHGYAISLQKTRLALRSTAAGRPPVAKSLNCCYFPSQGFPFQLP